MLRIASLAIVLIAINGIAAQVALYGQCGGENWTGGKNCVSGSVCTVKDKWYSQCLPSAGTTKKAGTTTPLVETKTKAGTTTPRADKTTPRADKTTTRAGVTTTANASKFPFGQLRHGRPYERGADMSQFDYVSAWVGYQHPLNPYHEGEMVEFCNKNGKTCQFYMYVIAFTARSMKGLQDCDVDPNYNLCTDGSQFIRDNRALLVSRYDSYAADIAKRYGTSEPKFAPIFMLEADLYQYSNNSYKHTQKGGPLSGAFLGALYNDFVSAIKKHIPNALISWDISAWLEPSLMRTWWSNFPAARIDFINTSGGQSRANTPEIKPGEIRYKTVAEITGKKILADCGYGVAGAPDSGCSAWGVKANIDARILDGIVAVNQANVQYPPTYKPKLP